MAKDPVTTDIQILRKDISKCITCTSWFAHEPNPVVRFSAKSKIVIIGQAPGTIVHHTGIPWDDKSGENLRKWMDITKDDFYNPDKIAIVPMGFCYPGKGKSGDLPPSKECAPQWHDKIFLSSERNSVSLTDRKICTGLLSKRKFKKESYDHS